MELQQRILDQYINMAPNQTLKKMSGETGLSISRLFRLLNGRVMKLSEYETIKRVISHKAGDEDSWSQLIRDCQRLLSKDRLNHLEEHIRRELSYAQMIQSAKSHSDSHDCLNLGVYDVEKIFVISRAINFRIFIDWKKTF